MKHLKIAGLCLASTLAMGMALAGNASATPLWLVCLPREAGTGHFEDPACLHEKAKSNWESVLIGSTTDKIAILAMTLTLTDLNTDLGIAITRCDHLSALGESGFIGPNNKGEITKDEVNAETECV